jgi:glutathione S-transferase
VTALYGEALFDSPFVYTVFVALKEKGIPFELRTVDLDRAEQKTPEFAERSLTARVPTLEVEGFSLSESLAIVEYLEESLPGPRLLPADVQERARARQVLGWLRSDLHALRAARPSSSLFSALAAVRPGERARAREPLGDKGQADADKLVRVACTLLAGRSGWLFGDFSLADADLGFSLMRLVVNGDALPAALQAYAERVWWTRPSVTAWVTLPRPAPGPLLGPL